jgi:SAM-dependent methyltransferase
MKFLLNFFPRNWLIKISIWLRPIIKFYFKGNKFIDPIDGSSYRRFLPYGYQNIRLNALCPGTLSLERHRLLWLYLYRETDFLKLPLNVLHIAPEQVFYKKFKCFNHWKYITADLYSPLADVKVDVCKLPFEDGYYDLILCNHVLEHIPDHKQAMKELCRVLKKGGTLINRIFGQYDHVRIYGKDFFSFLNQAGFKSKGIPYAEKLTEIEIKKYSLQKEIIPVATKI